MEEIAKLFYKSYIKENHKQHYQTSQELQECEKEFMGKLDEPLKNNYFALNMLYTDHMEERELKLIIYILELLQPEI